MPGCMFLYDALRCPGDRLLTGRGEYGSSVLAYWQVAARGGTEDVIVPNDPIARIDRAVQAVTEKQHMHATAGSRLRPTSWRRTAPVVPESHADSASASNCAWLMWIASRP